MNSEELRRQVTADVLGRIDWQHRMITIHEAAHAVAGYACGLELVEITAAFTGGHVKMTAGKHRADAVGAARAYLVMSIAGTVGEQLHIREVGSDHAWDCSASKTDLEMANRAIAVITAAYPETADAVIGRATGQAIDILQRNWAAVLAIDERLRAGKSLWNLNTVLSLLVTSEQIQN